MNQVLREINELTTSCEMADFLPNILGWHLAAVTGGSLPVVLFGAGSAGSYLCNALKIHFVTIAAFCDNNPALVGTRCGGHPVISLEELASSHRDCLIVISTARQTALQIHDQLLGCGFSEDRLHIPPTEPLLYYTNLVNQYCWTVAELYAHEQQLQAAFDLLSDQKSKELFVRRIALFASAYDYASFRRFIDGYADLHAPPGDKLFSEPRYDENYFYFNSDFCQLGEQEVFANVGALVGDCALEFAASCAAKGLEYREIINFEPDPNNFRQLVLNTQHLPNVRCLPYGLWSQRDRLRFSNPDPLQAGTPGSLSNDGTIEVDVASMDELIPDAGVTFIKMDIEGAELQALIGAIGTICQNRPKLAISLYHKRDDIFKIPLLLHNFYPDYKFYLRHYCTTFSETILFAVP
ncbi:MAG: FkbM family methyltransferase [Desulfuromonadales bacterium]|nr:FkbM family methyltransferase [Desulfuromonadales bacterium]